MRCEGCYRIRQSYPPECVAPGRVVHRLRDIVTGAVIGWLLDHLYGEELRATFAEAVSWAESMATSGWYR